MPVTSSLGRLRQEDTSSKPATRCNGQLKSHHHNQAELDIYVWGVAVFEDYLHSVPRHSQLLQIADELPSYPWSTLLFSMLQAKDVEKLVSKRGFNVPDTNALPVDLHHMLDYYTSLRVYKCHGVPCKCIQLLGSIEIKVHILICFKTGKKPIMCVECTGC